MEIVKPGPLALSATRLAGHATEVEARRMTALYIHFVSTFRRPTPEEQDTLDRLLTYGEQFAHDDELSALLEKSIRQQTTPKRPDLQVLYIVPRTGTISPWSSQATAIAHVCGMQQWVRRIERGVVFAVEYADDADMLEPSEWSARIYDRMTQQIGTAFPDVSSLFAQASPAPATAVQLMAAKSPIEILQKANADLGLALDDAEINYLVDAYQRQLRRDPTDVELFMFAQINSEHCRHKQFNASWIIDGEQKTKTLFEMIKNTHQMHPEHVISAYSDNAAVFEGLYASNWAPNLATGEWTQSKEVVHFLGKVETHNHPTAVSPYPGAATGSGGEIRDEGAVGRGSRPKAGLSGFCVSDLCIPKFMNPWEVQMGKPEHISKSLDIMLEAPIGSAAFNNEFGRPCTTGYFRTLLMFVPVDENTMELRGYHKPIMIAGGVGTVRPENALKKKGAVNPEAHLIVLGGPAMLIGLGGGAASSVQSGEGSAELDFASVQRGNAEVQRRAQEVINACTELGPNNPIQFIHDVGAGGLSNALPELVHDCGLGATFELREIDSADESLSPLQIWCCEAQERYVMAISESGLSTFSRIAKRERCGYSVVGQATQAKELILVDRESRNFPTLINLPMSVLFGKPPKMKKTADTRKLRLRPFDKSLKKYMPSMKPSNYLHLAVSRVLGVPSVGSKSFLITIGDRSVGGLSVRDQMVGPWQVPVADVSVTATSLLAGTKTGEAMAMGENPLRALISPAASARMAVAESLMNLAAADLMDKLDRVCLSANWMAASNHPGEAAALYEAVEAIGMELCPELGISIPVGKDSLSMKMKWTGEPPRVNMEVISPLSLVVTAFGLSRNVGNTWTPALRRNKDVGETLLMFVDLAQGKQAMGGSALAQSFGEVGDESPDIRDVDLFKDYFDAIAQLHESDIVLAYHDRSDGGLVTTLVEMMFAGRCGIDIMLDDIAQTSQEKDVVPALFNEELGAVFQIRKKDEISFNKCFATCGPPPGLIKRIGRIHPGPQQDLAVYHGAKLVYKESRSRLQRFWAATSYSMQELRDDPACALQEFENIHDDADPGLSYRLTFNSKENIMPLRSTISAAFTAKPRVAILREQGVNGQAEMAFAFHVAGFSAIDVHMTDIISGRVSLASFVGLAACGGFSYGDVLGAGRGWAMSVLLRDEVRKEFQNFFERQDTFALGVCNGCQFLSRIKEIIPGAASWPTFERNTSEQYEARVCMVKIIQREGKSPSVFFHGMGGSALPIATAHGEGKATFAEETGPNQLVQQQLMAVQYLDNRLRPTERYPFNPNGSPLGIAAVTTDDGRFLAMMPHPERTILKDVASWIPKGQDWGDFGPWVRMFKSARRWVG